MVHYPLVATSIGVVISYIYQWKHNRLLSPQGVTGRGVTSPPRCWAMQSLCTPSLSPWLRFLSILYSLLADHATSRYSLSTSFSHDIWSICHALPQCRDLCFVHTSVGRGINPAPHTWLCNQRSLPIHQSILYAVLRSLIHTLSCVSHWQVQERSTPSRFVLYLLLRFPAI